MRQWTKEAFAALALVVGVSAIAGGASYVVQLGPHDAKRPTMTGQVEYWNGTGWTSRASKDLLSSASGSVSVNGQKLTNVGSATADTDGANKLYVDTAVTSAAVPLPLSKSNGGFGMSVAVGLTNGNICRVAGGAIVIGAMAASDLPTGIDVSKLSSGVVSSSEFDFLDGTTSNIQLQLDGKQALLTLPLSRSNGGFGANISALSTGLLVQTASNTWAVRSVTVPTGMSITNPAGIAGNIAITLANDLAAIEALAGTGIGVRTGTDAWAQRSVVSGTGTTVTNGDGVSGNIAVNVTYGSASNTATQGNDSRLAPTPASAGRMIYDTGSAYAAIAAGTTSQVLIGGNPPSFGLVPSAALPSSGVTAATYPTAASNGMAQIAVDATGRITSASSISIPAAIPIAFVSSSATFDTTHTYRLAYGDVWSDTQSNWKGIYVPSTMKRVTAISMYLPDAQPLTSTIRIEITSGPNPRQGSPSSLSPTCVLTTTGTFQLNSTTCTSAITGNLYLQVLMTVLNADYTGRVETYIYASP